MTWDWGERLDLRRPHLLIHEDSFNETLGKAMKGRGTSMRVSAKSSVARGQHGRLFRNYPYAGAP